MGTGNMRVFLGLPECRVVAVCDAYQDRREKAREIVDAYNGDKVCAMIADWRELVARRDIDALMLAPQDHWHALMATAAAAAGKDMYCEKPIGMSVEEGQKVRQAIRQHQRIFQAGTWQRSQVKFRFACELARSGYLGRIHTVEVSTEGPHYRPSYKGSTDPQAPPAGFDWKMWRGPAPDRPYNPGRVAWPDWYLIYDYCVGFAVNWGVHHLDIALWGLPELAAKPCEIQCRGSFRKEGFTDNIDQWDATYTYADGLKLVFKDEHQLKTGCRFIGDKGWVHVDRSGLWAEPASLLKVKVKETETRLYNSQHHQANFLDCVRTRKDPVSDVDATFKASTSACSPTSPRGCRRS